MRKVGADHAREQPEDSGQPRPGEHSKKPAATLRDQDGPIRGGFAGRITHSCRPRSDPVPSHAGGVGEVGQVGAREGESFRCARSVGGWVRSCAAGSVSSRKLVVSEPGVLPLE